MTESEEKLSSANISNLVDVLKLAIAVFNTDYRCLAAELKEKVLYIKNPPKPTNKDLEHFHASATAFVMEAVGILREEFSGLLIGDVVPSKVLDSINIIDNKMYNRLSNSTLASSTTGELAQCLTDLAITFAKDRRLYLSDVSKRRKQFEKKLG
jgi:hypothetical protein